MTNNDPSKRFDDPVMMPHQFIIMPVVLIIAIGSGAFCVGVIVGALATLL